MGRPPVVNDHRADASQHDFSIFRRDTLTAAEGNLAAPGLGPGGVQVRCLSPGQQEHQAQGFILLVASTLAADRARRGCSAMIIGEGNGPFKYNAISQTLD
jgi:hypothetical protein